MSYIHSLTSYANFILQPKYWCKHCSTYVKDTPFERKQHESTGKHQGNLKRFLQGIQKDHAKVEREKDKAKAEVERLNRIVGSASSSTPLLGSGQPSRSAKSSPASLSAADQKRQWAQLAEMGIAVPGDAGADNATASDWQIVSRNVAPESESLQPDETLNLGIRKRKFEGQEEEEEAGETVVRKGWGSTTKRYPGQSSEDLGKLLAAPIFRKRTGAEASPKDEEKEEEVDNNIKREPTDSDIGPASPTQRHDHEIQIAASRHDPEIKNEATSEETKAHRLDDSQEILAPVFKKRRAKISQPINNAHG